MLGDLDLALHNATAEQATAVLHEAGFRGINECSDPLIYDRMHHLEPQADPSGSVCIELHREVLAREVPAQALPLAAMRRDATQVDWDGLRLWVPSAAHRLLHNGLHDAVQDESFRSGRRSLRQLFEFARLTEQQDAAGLNWTGQLARLDKLGGSGIGDAIRAHCLVCSVLFDQPLPEGVQPGRAARLSERRLWFRIERPGWWWVYASARRLRGLAANVLTPHWYPSKWRQLRRAWQAAG